MKMVTERIICCFTFAYLFTIPMRGQTASHWSCNNQDYQYDMTLYLQLKASDRELDYSTYEMAAFKGKECRGTAKLLYLDDTNNTELLCLRLWSNVIENDTLDLKIYDKIEKIEKRLTTKIVFRYMSLIGIPISPLFISIDDSEKKYITDRCKVTFLADGIVVKQETLDYGTEITIPNAPNKEGYTFVSWGDVDKTVPPFDVTYTAIYTKNSIKGDVNGDGKVDISDIVSIINTIATDSSNARSDVNGDSKTDISDIVSVINIIANAS